MSKALWSDINVLSSHDLSSELLQGLFGCTTFTFLWVFVLFCFVACIMSCFSTVAAFNVFCLAYLLVPHCKRLFYAFVAFVVFLYREYWLLLVNCRFYANCFLLLCSLLKSNCEIQCFLRIAFRLREQFLWTRVFLMLDTKIS